MGWRASAFLLFFGVALLAAPSAGADERSLARDHYVKGTKEFELGLYDAAVQEYMAAYEIKDDPALLYNIAQAHRLAGHAGDALRFYRRFLMKAPNSAQRDDVEQKIAELQKLVDQQARTQSLPPESTIRPNGSSDAPVVSPTPTPAPALSPTAPPPAVPSDSAAAHGRTKKLAGVATAAAGVALLGVGTAFAVLAKNASDDLNQLNRNKQTYDPAKYDAGKRDQILGGVFLGVGGAAVVAGAVVYALGYRESHSAGLRATVAPLVAPTVVGASLQLGF